MRKSKKERYAEFVEKARGRDLSWSLLFLKNGGRFDEIEMSSDPNKKPEVRLAAIKEFERKHVVNSWRNLADEHKDQRVDLG